MSYVELVCENGSMLCVNTALFYRRKLRTLLSAGGYWTTPPWMLRASYVIESMHWAKHQRPLTTS